MTKIRMEVLELLLENLRNDLLKIDYKKGLNTMGLLLLGMIHSQKSTIARLNESAEPGHRAEAILDLALELDRTLTYVYALRADIQVKLSKLGKAGSGN